MCGIVGIAGKLNIKSDKIFKNLLILDTIRGIDSTGIAAVDNLHEVKVFKQIGTPFDLFGYRNFDTIINKQNRVLIGHNRFATQGVVSRKNAHPFEFDNLVGVHNGTLHNKHRLKDNNTFSVDSENLYWHIQEEGIEDLMEKIDGAWSLVWWDKVTAQLNFLRNKERPMWIAPSQDETLIAWASEPWMLDVACDREDIKWQAPVSTKIDHLYTFDINKDGEIDKPHVKPMEAKSVHLALSHGQGNFHNGRKVNAGNLSVQNIPSSQRINISITPTGKVVVFPKSRVTPITVSKRVCPTSTNLYAGCKDVILEVLALNTDAHGSKYLVCFDVQNRAARIRLYLKRGDEETQYINKDIICTVGPKYADSKDGLYYKVEHSSVKLHTLKTLPIEDNLSSNDAAGAYFPDAKGKLLNIRTWNTKYSQCNFCTQPVFPKDPNRFTVDGEIICAECATDEKIHEYVQLA